MKRKFENTCASESKSKYQKKEDRLIGDLCNRIQTVVGFTKGVMDDCEFGIKMLLKSKYSGIGNDDLIKLKNIKLVEIGETEDLSLLYEKLNEALDTEDRICFLHNKINEKLGEYLLLNNK